MRFHLVLCLLGALASSPAFADLPEPETISVPGPRTSAMKVRIYKPDGPGPFPVVIFSHGRNAEKRLELSNPVLPGHAGYWMRKGFVVVAPFRPGYGLTGGLDRESSNTRIDKAGECSGVSDIPAALRQSSAAVSDVLDWVRTRDWARKDRILLVGQSVGGATSVALGAKNPPGVVGFINFAGGHAGAPDRRPGRSCAPEQIEAFFRTLGKEARLPSLWLYSENDLYWGSEMPKRWHAAFVAGGAKARFVMTPPVEDDGHRLLARGGKLWSVHVDAFVKELGF